MRFRQYFEALNPHMYDLSTPVGRKEYEDDLKWLQDFQARPRPKEIKRDAKQEQYQLECWRGCTLESLKLMTVQTGNGHRVIDGRRSRSGALWFAHEFQGDAGKQNALNHGEVFITHYLTCSIHYDIVAYDNGQSQQEPARAFLDKVGVYSESPVAVFGNKVVVLPSGWSFSEHGEKHVLCLGQVAILERLIQIGR